MRNVSVYAGHDGVDVRSCDNVLIEDRTFNTGDDCVAGLDLNDAIVRNVPCDREQIAPKVHALREKYGYT